MSINQSSISFFNESGRRILTRPYRVFDTEDLSYYFIQNKDVDLSNVLKNFHVAGIGKDITLEKFQTLLERLALRLKSVRPLSNIFNGVHIPFIIPKLDDTTGDLSYTVVERFLPYLESSFKSRYPEAHFKAIMQAGSTLFGNLRVDDRSRYGSLLNAASESDLIGWYFPQALQQFDIESQVEQVKELPEEPGLCLSGPMEVLAANIGKPDLLINNEGYAPILTMPSVRHINDCLALVLKSYGPHLEFWCLSNELTPGVKQVSEQWAGGYSLFSKVG